MPKLHETGFAHCLLNNDVDNLTHGLTICPVGILHVRRVYDILTIVINLQSYWSTHVLCIEVVAFRQLLWRPNVSPRMKVLAQYHFKLAVESTHNLFQLHR